MNTFLHRAAFLKGRAGKIIIFTAVFFFLSYFLYQFNSGYKIPYNQQGGTSYVKYEKAKVLEVVNEDLKRDPVVEGVLQGTQELRIKLLTGEYKGEERTITNYLSNLNNIHAKEGLTFIARVDAANADTYDVSVFSYHRAPILYALILLFFAVLWLMGGKKGLKSVVGIVCTFVFIIFLFIPMLFRGYSPILSSVLIVVLTTCITLLLLDGFTTKAWSAILGTTAGVIVAAVIAAVAGKLAHVTGFNTGEAESLIIMAADSGMKVEGLLFAGILIASLGAIMDMAISIASSVHEVYNANSKLSTKELFWSGLNVGRDMMGTMANTLILAFTGASLTSLIVIYAYQVPYNQLVNMNMIAIEIIQGISGSISIVITVPMIAYICAQFIPRFHKFK